MTATGEHVVIEGASVNGTPAADAAPSPSPSGPRIPRREAWIDLPGEYPEMRVRAWVNYPQRLATEIASGDEERMRAALRQVFLEHNGWLDEEGEPLPPITTDAFWMAIPNELAAVLLTVLQVEATKLPNGLIPRNGRR